MPRMLAPEKKEIRIKNGPGLSEDDPLVVVFHQATLDDLETREDMLKRRVERSWPDEGDYRESLEMANILRQRAVEVWLTISAFNGLAPNGKELLKFREKNGRMRPAYKTFNEFRKDWVKIDPEWARMIHVACLIVNPSWGQPFYDEDNYDILTPGEESGANKD